jgi:NADPH:quinone reductase-like Zn-dependent oxidoreductase
MITEPGDPGVLKVGTVSDPVPGSDEVLIRVRATALNRILSAASADGSQNPRTGVCRRGGARRCSTNLG